MSLLTGLRRCGWIATSWFCRFRSGPGAKREAGAARSDGQSGAAPATVSGESFRRLSATGASLGTGKAGRNGADLRARRPAVTVRSSSGGVSRWSRGPCPASVAGPLSCACLGFLSRTSFSRHRSAGRALGRTGENHADRLLQARLPVHGTTPRREPRAALDIRRAGANAAAEAACRPSITLPLVEKPSWPAAAPM